MSQTQPESSSGNITKYTIHIRDSIFTLRHDQITFDSPNYFSNYFLGGWQESTQGKREMHLSKDPLLFKLIEAHLSGYTVLPIPEKYIPDYMTKENVLDNLLEDAKFFALTLLEERLFEFIQLPVDHEPYRYYYEITHERNGVKTLRITSLGAETILKLNKDLDPSIAMRTLRIHQRAGVIAAWPEKVIEHNSNTRRPDVFKVLHVLFKEAV